MKGTFNKKKYDKGDVIFLLDIINTFSESL